MRYFQREIDVKAIVDAGLAVRALARTNENVNPTDFSSQIAEAYDGWTAELIDTILDFAEREQRVAKRIRSWRNHVKKTARIP